MFKTNPSRGPLAVLVLSLLAGSSHSALAQLAPPPAPPAPSYAPFEIPLDIVSEGGLNGTLNPTNPYPEKTSTAYRLGITLGLGGAKPVLYILDTGSTAFNVAVGAKYDVGAGVPWFIVNPAFPIDRSVSAQYGDGSYGNIAYTTSIPTIEFYSSNGAKVASYANPDGIGLTLNTQQFATQESLGTNKAGVVVGYYSPTAGFSDLIGEFDFYTVEQFQSDYPDAVPVYANQSWQETIDSGRGPADVPYGDKFFGIFGAGDFVKDSVLGSLTKTGYVVAANGEVGPNHDCAVTCAHVILNLTDAIRAQFTNILPWTGGAKGTFPMSGAPVSANQYDVAFDFSLSNGVKTVSGRFDTLLDSGTPTYVITDDKFLADATDAGFFDKDSTANFAGTGGANGNIFSGLSFTARDGDKTDPTTIITGNEYFGDGTYSGQLVPGTDPTAIHGLPFYLANSVMYDLENNRNGYTPFFVSIAPIDTTGGYAVTSDMRPQGIAGVISGSGAFHIAAGGSAQLSEANTYTGATIVDRAGLLVLVGPLATIAKSAGVQVDGMLDVSGMVESGISISSLSGAGVVELGSHLLRLTNASGVFSGRLVDGGLRGGDGAGLTLDAGIETLSGANSYSGSTTINDGTLVLTGGGAIADSGQVVIQAASGTLQIDEAEAIGSLAGTGGKVVLNATLTTGGDNSDSSYGGAVTGVGGVVKIGSGAFTMAGTGAYSGSTTIKDGILRVEGGSAIGDSASVTLDTPTAKFEIGTAETIGSVAGGGQVLLDAKLTTGGDNTDAVYAGVISGTGMLDKIGTGVFALTGANSYSGGTLIENGALVGNTISLHGAITDNATLTFLQNVDGEYKDALSGSGAVVKDGTGALTLSGANAITGTTFVQEGTLILQGGAAVADTAKVEVDTGKTGSGTLQVNTAETIGGLTGNGGSVILGANLTTGGDNSTSGYAGVISGAGALIKQGSGTLLLTGMNSYRGGTTVTGGVLQGSTSAIQGDIVNNAQVVFTQDKAGSYGGRMSGSGGVVIAGANGQAVSFTGINAYAGDTEITQGLFNLDGVQQSSRTIVDAGATLGGSGTSHGILVRSGGTVSPGHSIGTLSDTGGIQFEPGSVYHVEIKGGTLSDHLVTTGAAVIKGATLLVTLEHSRAPITLAELEALGTSLEYDILSAKGGVTGSFATSLPDYVFFDSKVMNTANAVQMSLSRNDVSFAAVGATANEQAVGAGIHGLGVANPIYDRLLASQTLKEAQSLEHQLSGEIHGDVAGQVLDGGAMLRNAVLGRLNSRTPGSGAFWFKALDSAGIANADGNAAKLNRQTGGLSGGADVALGQDWLIGAGLSYESSPLRTTGQGSATVTSYHISAYSGLDVDGFALRVGGLYGHDKAKTVRQITVPSFAAVEQAHYGVNEGSAFGEIGYGFVAGDSTIAPFADVSWTQANLGDFAESAGPAALEAKAATIGRTQSILGARYSLAFHDNNTIFVPNLTLGWVHNFNSTTPSRRLGFIDGADDNGFVVAGASANTDAGLVRAGLDAMVGAGISLGIGYEGQYGTHGQDQAVRLNLRANY